MNWPNVALGDLFEIARGGSPRPIADFLTEAANGVNWISISDASSSSKYIRSTKRKIDPSGVSRSRRVEPGDFLLTNSMSFGRPYIMATSGCIHDGWLSLSPKSDRTDPDYLFQALSSPDTFRKFERLASGATVKNLNIDLVRTMEIPLPPLEEQRRIATILDHVDDLRRRRREACNFAELFVPSLFEEMFGDPVLNSGKWDMSPLGGLTSKIGSGATPNGGAASYKLDGTPLIRSMNVRDGYFAREGLAFIDRYQAENLDNVIVNANDVLLNITGASVARVCRAPPSLHSARVNQHVAIIRPTKRLLPQFLEAALLHSRSKATLLRIAESGATRQAITKSQLEQYNMIVPPIHSQLEFSNRVSAFEEASLHQSSSSQLLDRLFASLQHRAFNGELTSRQADRGFAAAG